MSKPTRPALRYHGGKWRLAAPWIISHFPEHTAYVEPFGGGASVLLRKDPAFVEVYNDLNGDVVNFFRVLRERPEDLIRAIELTPYARAEFLACQAPCDDDLERARRVFVWAWQGRGRIGVFERGGWRFMARASRSRTNLDDFNNIGHLWDVAQRLKQVQIECDDALRVIERYDTPDTLFYLDPPYLQEKRCRRWHGDAYVFEYSDEDHEDLARVLAGIEGMAVVSGYSSALYDRLYDGWRCVCKEVALDSSGNGKKPRRVECLWLSPRTWAALGRPEQLRLGLEV